MLFKTEGIVLRTIRYGETSIIATIFTELFGIQSYLINGVRTEKRKNGKANLFQPAHILSLVVYHRSEKNLQRISQYKPAYLYLHLYSNMIKNTLALYTMELLDKSLTEPEANPELFYFIKETLQWMDVSPTPLLGLLPPFVTLKTASLLGFEINGRYDASNRYLDLYDGSFTTEEPLSEHLSDLEAQYTYQLLQIQDTKELARLSIPKKSREKLLSAYLHFMKYHISGFRELKSPEILKEILS